MDAQESEEPQANRKIPIDQLSKDELVKKYRQAIVIAQKAKESKSELMKHISQHENVIKTLEEKLQKAEDEKKVLESKCLRRFEEVETDVSMPVHKEKIVEPLSSELQAYQLENCRLTSELKEAKDKITNLESGILKLETDVDKLNVDQQQLEKIVTAKENELKSLKGIASEERLMWDKIKEELTSKILGVEESLEYEKSYHREQLSERDGMVESLKQLISCKDEEIEKQKVEYLSLKSDFENSLLKIEERDKSLEMAERTISALSSQVEELWDSQEQLTSENSKLMQEISRRDEDMHIKEDSTAQLSLELGDSKNSFNLLKVELTEKIKQFENQEKVLDETLSDFKSKVDELKSSNDHYLQRISALEADNAALSDQICRKVEEVKKHEEDSRIELDKFIKELSDKSNILMERDNVIAQLQLNVETLNATLSEQGDHNIVEELSAEKNRLEQEIILKDDKICKIDGTVKTLSKKLDELKNQADNIPSFKNRIEKVEEELSEKLELLKKCDSTMKQLESELAERNRELIQKDEIISSLSQRLEALMAKEGVSSDLRDQLESIEIDLSEKCELLKEKESAITAFKTQIEELNKALSERASYDTVKELLAAKSNLEKELLQKSDEILKKDDAINCLSLNLKEMKEELMSSKLMGDKSVALIETLKTECDNSSKRINAVEKEKESLLSELDIANKKLEDKAESINLMENKLSTALDIQQELRDQLNTLQSVLCNKESVIQDLEQEIYKLRDVVANDSTNTEVSSTFSLSRAEEHSRLRDLEDSFEDKYTKLRVVAVKLKKRVTDLTQTLDGERSKMATEKSDLLSKISQLASQAKTVQTLQSEVDRLQDLLEEQKKIQNQLKKDLESAVRDAASTKSQLAALQEELHCVNYQKKSLETEKSNLELALSNAGDLNSETKKLFKELKEKDLLLETFKEEKQKLSEQLDKVCADAKKKSVLSLEMADMEKSVSELTRQLSLERERLKCSENELEKERSTSSTLQDKLKKFEGQLGERDIAIQQLKDVITSSKEECESYKKRCKEKEGTIEQLSNQLEKQRSLVEELNLQCSELAAKQAQTKETARLQIEALSRQVFQLEEQCSALQGSNKALEDDLATVQTDFENYKVRAQSVLRQTTKQEDRGLSSSAARDAEELELEVERLRVNVSNLKASLSQATSQLQAVSQEVGVERDEKTRALKLAQASRDACAQAVERQHAAEERLSVAIEEAKQAKLHSDTLIQCYKQQLEDLKTTHQKKVASLTEQLENLQASLNNNPTSAPTESEPSSNALNASSPVSGWTVQQTSAAYSDSDLLMRLSSLQREEGEGSESVDSFPSRRISVTTQEKRHELVPLDKLLSSSTYPEDDIVDSIRTNSSDINVDLLQSKLSACESRAAHLTALLSEAESDAARLSQLNSVLKEEIRRQQRCEEREQHAHNLEYLKNIVVKFITLQNGDERQRLVPVLNTILKLSPEEAGLVASVAKGNSQANSGARGWGSYLPLPGWTGT